MAKAQPTTAIVDWHSTEAAARISGLSKDMVNYLCRYGIVTPSGSKSRGHGTVRKYIYTDVLLLRVIAKLLEQGISALRLKKCFKALQKRGGQTNEIVSKRFVATDGCDIYFGNGTILEQLGSGQMTFAFVIELRAVRREIEQYIAKAA